MTTRIIAMLDRAEGNASVGTMWTETRSFDASEPISALIAWADTKRVRFNTTDSIQNLRIQIDEAPQ